MRGSSVKEMWERGFDNGTHDEKVLLNAKYC